MIFKHMPFSQVLRAFTQYHIPIQLFSRKCPLEDVENLQTQKRRIGTGCDKFHSTGPAASGAEQAAVSPGEPQRCIAGDATSLPLSGISSASGKAETAQNKATQLVCPCLRPDA